MCNQPCKSFTKSPSQNKLNIQFIFCCVASSAYRNLTATHRHLDFDEIQEHLGSNRDMQGHFREVLGHAGKTGKFRGIQGNTGEYRGI